MCFNRNKSHIGAPQQSCREIIHKAQSMLEDFKLAQLRRPQHKEAADAHWIPPDFLKYIVNTDAVVFSNTDAVVRNHEGSVIAALSRRLPLSLGPLKAEVKAMDEVVYFAKDIGLLSSKHTQPSSMVLSLALVSIDNIVGILHNCNILEVPNCYMFDDKETNQLILRHITPKELIIL